MKTCSNGTSLWKPSTKASQLFTQRNTEAAEEKQAERERERKSEEKKEKQIEEVEQEGVRGEERRKQGDR